MLTLLSSYSTELLVLTATLAAALHALSLRWRLDTQSHPPRGGHAAAAVIAAAKEHELDAKVIASRHAAVTALEALHVAAPVIARYSGEPVVLPTLPLSTLRQLFPTSDTLHASSLGRHNAATLAGNRSDTVADCLSSLVSHEYGCAGVGEVGEELSLDVVQQSLVYIARCFQQARHVLQATTLHVCKMDAREHQEVHAQLLNTPPPLVAVLDDAPHTAIVASHVASAGTTPRDGMKRAVNAAPFSSTASWHSASTMTRTVQRAGYPSAVAGVTPYSGTPRRARIFRGRSPARAQHEAEERIAATRTGSRSPGRHRSGSVTRVHTARHRGVADTTHVVRQRHSLRSSARRSTSVPTLRSVALAVLRAHSPDAESRTSRVSTPVASSCSIRSRSPTHAQQELRGDGASPTRIPSSEYLWAQIWGSHDAAPHFHSASSSDGVEHEQATSLDHSVASFLLHQDASSSAASYPFVDERFSLEAGAMEYGATVQHAATTEPAQLDSDTCGSAFPCASAVTSPSTPTVRALAAPIAQVQDAMMHEGSMQSPSWRSTHIPFDATHVDADPLLAHLAQRVASDEKRAPAYEVSPVHSPSILCLPHDDNDDDAPLQHDIHLAPNASLSSSQLAGSMGGASW
ncbi:MAG: hypothetical protein EOO41_01440, partial [Methanobacteriota archaeon]